MNFRLINGRAAHGWVRKLCAGLFVGLLFDSANAADTTPPTISSFTARQSIIQDFPIHVTFLWTNYHGPCYDPSTGITVSQAIYLQWPVTSNWVYTVWFGPSLFGPWQEWGTSTNIHPVRVSGVASTFVPVYPLSNRYYQIRADNSFGDTYP